MVLTLKRKRIFKNSAYSSIQVVVLGLILFFLYRYLLGSIGSSGLGVWSIVLAFTSMARIADLGMPSSVVRYLSKHQARGDFLEGKAVIQTALCTVVFTMGFLSFAIYPLYIWALRGFLTSDSVDLAYVILPWVLIAGWVNAIAAIFLAGLDGLQRTDLKSVITTCGGIVFFLLVILLVNYMGIIGLAYAQLSQSIFILISSWILFKREYKFQINLKEFRLKKLKEIFSYGINAQINMIAVMLCEPVTKSLLAKYGDISMVGYYEIANRMVAQMRSILVSATEILVPIVSGAQEKSPAAIDKYYKLAYELSLYIAIPYFAMLAILGPIISIVWLGENNTTFTNFVTMVSITSIFNIVSNIAYFTNLGMGRQKWNTIGHICIAILNIILGWFFGFYFSGESVVLALSISITIGCLLILIAYHLENGMRLVSLLPLSNFYSLLLTMIAIYLSYILRINWNKWEYNVWISITLSLLIIGLVLIPVALSQTTVKIIKHLKKFIKEDF